MSGKYPFDHIEVRNLKPAELFAILDDWLNSNPFRECPKEFSKALNETHRTLQELFVGFVWSCLLNYGKDHKEKWSADDRNDDARLLTLQLVEMTDNNKLPTYLRYI